MASKTVTSCPEAAPLTKPNMRYGGRRMLVGAKEPALIPLLGEEGSEGSYRRAHTHP